MTKREEKLNRLWTYLQKVSKKEDLERFNMRAFLYSVGRMSYEQALIELVAFYFGRDSQDEELKAVIQIIEGEKAL